METLKMIFPKEIRPEAERLIKAEGGIEHLEEIRIRIRQPVQFLFDTKEVWHSTNMTESMMEEMLNYISGYSMYAYQEEFSLGYVTIRGGHRVGMSGVVKMKGEDILRMQQIYFMNIRVAKEKKGCAKEVYQYIWNEKNEYENTMLISLPGAGKTTLLRDLIRMLSEGDFYRAGKKICVIDERSEIAAAYQGIPQNDIGCRTDILEGCKKIAGMRMLLRSMSPQIIALDEMGGKTEYEALEDLLHTGCKVLATMHSTYDMIKEEKIRQKLPGFSCFQRFVFLQRQADGKRTYQICNASLDILWSN